MNEMKKIKDRLNGLLESCRRLFSRKKYWYLSPYDLDVSCEYGIPKQVSSDNAIRYLVDMDVLNAKKHREWQSAQTISQAKKSFEEQENAKCIPLKKENLQNIRVGMLWYEDDTCSFERMFSKRIKAVIELIEDNAVFGDLTVSELQDIQEKVLNWDDAQKYINNFSYPCKENEKIVWYNFKQFKKLYKTYAFVRCTFSMLGKRDRMIRQWTSLEDCKQMYIVHDGNHLSFEYTAWYACYFNMHNGRAGFIAKRMNNYDVRPVLRKVIV